MKEQDIEQFLKSFKVKPIDLETRQRILTAVSEDKSLVKKIKKIDFSFLTYPSEILLSLTKKFTKKTYQSASLVTACFLIVILSAHLSMVFISTFELDKSMPKIDTKKIISNMSVPDSQNAAIDILQASSIFKNALGENEITYLASIGENNFSVNSQNKQIIANILGNENVNKILSLTNNAAEKQSFNTSNIKSDQIDYSAIKNIAMINILNAETANNKGKPDEAIENIHKCMKLSKLIASDNNFVSADTAIYIDKVALNNLNLILNNKKIDNNTLTKIENELNSVDWRVITSAAIIKEESQLYESWKKNPESAKKQLVKESTSITQKIQNSLLNYTPLLKLKIADFQKDLYKNFSNIEKNQALTKTDQNLYSENLNGLFNVDPKTVVENSYYQQSKVESGKIYIALKKYHNRYASYPNFIDNLVPEFMSKLPTDPLNGKHFVYEKNDKGFVVYSEGISSKNTVSWQENIM